MTKIALWNLIKNMLFFCRWYIDNKFCTLTRLGIKCLMNICVNVQSVWYMTRFWCVGWNDVDRFQRKNSTQLFQNGGQFVWSTSDAPPERPLAQRQLNGRLAGCDIDLNNSRREMRKFSMKRSRAKYRFLRCNKWADLKSTWPVQRYHAWKCEGMCMNNYCCSLFTSTEQANCSSLTTIVEGLQGTLPVYPQEPLWWWCTMQCFYSRRVPLLSSNRFDKDTVNASFNNSQIYCSEVGPDVRPDDRFNFRPRQ